MNLLPSKYFSNKNTKHIVVAWLISLGFLALNAQMTLFGASTDMSVLCTHTNG